MLKLDTTRAQTPPGQEKLVSKDQGKLGVFNPRRKDDSSILNTNKPYNRKLNVNLLY